MIIGITGKIGAGKSDISKILSEKTGYELLDLDGLVNKLYDNPHVIIDLNQEFGVSSKHEIKKLDLNEDKLYVLSKIFLPYIVGILLTLYGRYIVEIPLLFEKNMSYLCNITINVSTSTENRRNRINDRLKSNFELINSTQMSNANRNMFSDYTINNDGPISEIPGNIDEIIEQINWTTV